MLEVREPTGVDAEAWAWLQAQSSTEWRRRLWFEHGTKLASGLIERFPASEYARHGAGFFISDRVNGAASLQTAIDLSQGTWLADYYRAMQLGNRANLIDPACAEKTSDECAALMARNQAEARTQLNDLAQRTSSPTARHLALAVRDRLDRERSAEKR